MVTQAPNESRDAQETRIGWRMAGIGMTVASEVAAGTLLGWLFDKWRGHGTVGVLIGAVAGIAVGLMSLIRNSMILSAELDRTPRKDIKPLKPDEPLDDWSDRERNDSNQPDD
jgi:F0F1-type ATP synthase assembly protein I